MRNNNNFDIESFRCSTVFKVLTGILHEIPYKNQLVPMVISRDTDYA